VRLEETTFSWEEMGGNASGDAESDAFLTSRDLPRKELAKVITDWLKLPKAIRAVLVSLLGKQQPNA
jgi:hypothetical protein